MEKWRWTLVVMGMFCFGSVWGQFGKERVIEECMLLCKPETPLFVDFDGDNDLDITFSNYSNEIAWYENLANGRYKKRLIVELKFYNQFACVIDLDKDLDIDIVTAGADGKIYWYRNDGEGAFTQQLIINARHPAINIYYKSIGELEVADYDMDGDLDILVRFIDERFLQWYVNRNNAFFADEKIENSESLRSISVLNIDDDKDLEVVFLSYNLDKIGFYDRIGQKYEKQIIIEKPLGLWVKELIFKDMDKDDKIDIVFSAAGPYQYNPPSRIGYLKNQGNHVFSPPITLLEAYQINSLLVDDINHDGINDIVLTEAFQKFVKIYNRNPQNSFVLIKQIFLEIDDNDFLGAHDLNNDGVKDLVLGSYIYGFLGFHYQSQDWNFSPQTISKSRINGLKAAFSLDLNGDKINEIVVGASTRDPTSFISYVKDGRQNIAINKELNFPMLSMNDFVPFDADGDNEIEILFSAHGLTKLGWFEYEKSNNAPEIKSIDTGNESLEHICIVDLDNDQKDDIVVCVSNGQKVMWFRNEGKGQFSQKMTIVDNLGYIRSLEASDLDNDGRKDLIIEVAEHLFWVKNNGSGRFNNSTTIRNYSAGYFYAYQLTDLDLDGDDDLIFEQVDTRKGSRIEWLENKGNGAFLEAKVLCNYDEKIPYQSLVLSVGDVDKDGDSDVVFSSGESIDGRLFWIENQGTEVFAEPTLIGSILTSVKKIQLSNLDGDSDLDVLIIYGDNLLSWVENIINTPNISGVAFWDKNANGKFDPNESIIKNLPIQLTPSATSTFTGSDGKYRFYVPDGQYQISVQPDECWQLTTDSLTYTVSIAENVSLNKNFGFQLVPKAQAVQPRLSSGPTRCGFDVPFVLSVHNEGCVPSKGMFGLVRSPLAKYLGASIFPDRVKGDTLLWNYSTLVGTAAQQLRLNFQIAGTDFLGDTIHIKTLAYLENPQGQLQLASTFDYRSEIRCAYDPNDKLTFPNRRSAYPRNYTLFKEEMEFLVRFQNTGNDTAFTVVIRDTLDKNLDWSSFRPLAGSHPFETHIQENGALSFTFKNILLPDSKTNEPLSHGFVSYRVSPKPGLPEQTEINNTAYIYFDFNPPIQTNTTSNVMVSSLPRVTKTKDINSSLDHKLYPNPFDDELLLEISAEIGGGDYSFSLINSQSQIVQHKKVTRDIEQIDTKHLPSGLYFYLIKNAQGQVVASGKVICR